MPSVRLRKYRVVCISLTAIWLQLYAREVMDLVELQPDFEHAEHLENKIERRNELSYNDFYWEYMTPDRNFPVLLTGVSNEWDCRRNWTLTSHESDKRLINFDYLRRKIPNSIVPVSDCTTEYFNSHAKLEMQFHDFLDYWMTKIESEKRSAKEQNSNKTFDNKKNLYLKDWHLKSQMPDYDFYCVPKQFASDFLNEYLIANGRDDYRFVYMGPKDSWTPFHADVFGSYSWSTNIIGCKKWYLLPPGEELKLVSRGNLPFAIDEALLEAKNVRFFTLFQEENEALFVPSGWYHQVMNLTDTISVNHNFFNACNLSKIWNNLATSMRQVIAEIEDCRQMDNFNEHCQTMLRASFGMNYLDFLDMLEFVTHRRLRSGNGNQEVSSDFILFGRYSFNNFHLNRDVISIQTVLEMMISDDSICNSRSALYQRCTSLLEAIKRDINQLV